jgi:HD-GYP domain-containing protein (c-di-GMP phosphodiesterase class II)
MVPVSRLVRSTHERWDGAGYPDGLSDEEIPLGSRIIFACDAFDAMRSDRPYAPPMSTEDSIAELQRNAGTQFDPRVVSVLCELVSVESESPNIAANGASARSRTA